MAAKTGGPLPLVRSHQPGVPSRALSFLCRPDPSRCREGGGGAGGTLPGSLLKSEQLCFVPAEPKRPVNPLNHPFLLLAIK